MDVLLASASPDEVLAGKLLGLGGAGLLQVTLWLSFLFMAGIGIVPLVLSAHVQVPWLGLALALPLFIVSFLFYGSLMLGTGSLGSNMRESQQLAMVWSLTAALARQQARRVPRRTTTTRIWEPALAGLCLVYFTQVIRQALHLYGIL